MRWPIPGKAIFALLLLTQTIHGELTRQANTTLRMPATPQQETYSLEPAFGTTFKAPVAIAHPPGETGRLFIVEKDNARILVITDLAEPTPTPVEFLNLRSKVIAGGEKGLLGLAFHPNYAENGYFYVFYTASVAGELRDRLSRFKVSASDINAADPNSEINLIDQFDPADEHNAGDLHFGPDGYLYVSLGDGGLPGDLTENSQRIDKSFFSGILRIDVDMKPGNLAPNPHLAISETANYSVPADNPFIGATTFNGLRINAAAVRTEFWAVGLRNPWRFSFDPLTGELWCADVGQGLYEEVDIIVKGGNYGWNFREGEHAFAQAPKPPPGFSGIDPVFEYPRALGSSVIGGLVYRGAAIPPLNGAYIFADYVSGAVWSLRTNALGKGSVEKLTINPGIASFGIDPSNGDILAVDVDDGVIWRLLYSPVITGTPIPLTLAETGIFSDLQTLTPHPGIYRYDVNLPAWSDGAEKTHWFSIPDLAKQISFDKSGAWQFPTGAVFIEHFEIQTNDNPVAKRRLETRVLTRTTNGIYGATYRWTDELNATLVDLQGLDEKFTVRRAGANRMQTNHYPSRVECWMCHNASAGYVLGFNARQLNRDFNYGGDTTNQIAALAKAGFFAQPPRDYHEVAALAGPLDSSASQEFRVRSYLDVNCAHCHRPGGLPRGNFDARLSTPTDSANLINGDLLNKSSDPRIKTLVPKSTQFSDINRRMGSRTSIKMPPITALLADADGVALMTAFINGELATRQSFSQWQVAKFNEPLPPEAAATADGDSDGASNLLEWLAGTDPAQSGDAWGVRARAVPDGVELRVNQPANRGALIEVTSDFDHWQPVDHPSNRLTFPSAGGERVISDSLTPSAERFYRARIINP